MGNLTVPNQSWQFAEPDCFDEISNPTHDLFTGRPLFAKPAATPL